MSRSDFWFGKRVFVTGSSGFLGSWMVQTLSEHGATVVGLVRDRNGNGNSLGTPNSLPNFTVYGQIEDMATLRRAVNEYEPDVVMHLAAQPIVGIAVRDPVGTFEANLRGTWNLLEACRLYGKANCVIIASSDKAYGHAEQLPYTEDMPLVGRAPYDVSKSCTDLLARSYFETYGLPVCMTRAGNFYGGGDLNFNRIVPGTVSSALRGEPPRLRSDGTMVRDYIYVRDVVRGYMAIAEAIDKPGVSGEAFNLSHENPISVLDLTQRILLASGRSDLEPIILAEAKAEIQAQYLSARKAREQLGWTAQWSMDEGLAETVAWYRNHFDETRQV